MREQYGGFPGQLKSAEVTVDQKEQSGAGTSRRAVLGGVLGAMLAGPALGTEAAETMYTEEEQRIISEVTGMAIEDFRQRYQAEFLLPSRNGRILVHIGQIHSTAGRAGPESERIAIQNQQALENLLRSIAALSTPSGQKARVLSEGFVDNEEVLSQVSEELRNLRARIEGIALQLPVTQESIDQHVNGFDQLHHNMLGNLLVFHELGDLAKTWEERLTDGALTLGRSDIVEKVIQLRQERTRRGLTPHTYSNGVAFRLSVEGLITLVSAESIEHNTQATELIERRETLMMQAIEAYNQGLDLRGSLLSTRADRMVPEVESAIHNSRDEEVVRRVILEQQRSGGGRTATYVVFGQSHNFSSALKQLSNEGGLVRITVQPITR